MEINFYGILDEQMCGLYRPTYVELDRKTHIMATTQFEPINAQHAFPCFNKPALKATLLRWFHWSCKALATL
jgi:aminopeptidase N